MRPALNYVLASGRMARRYTICVGSDLAWQRQQVRRFTNGVLPIVERNWIC